MNFRIGTRPLSPFIVFLLLFVMLSISLTIRWKQATSPIYKLAQFQADDAYYYLGTAFNFVQGRGSSFDRFGNPSNGYHPLFMLITAGIISVSSSMGAAIHTLAKLTVFVTVLSGIFLFFLVRHLTSHNLISLVLVCFWLFSPDIYFTSLNGFETSFYNFFLLGTFYFYLLHFNKPQNTLSTKFQVILGVLLGLTILTRTEGIFLLVLVPMDIVWRNWRTEKNVFLYIPFKTCFTTFLIIAPWFFWNLIEFGSITQTSSIHHRSVGLEMAGMINPRDPYQMPSFFATFTAKNFNYGSKLFIEFVEKYPQKFLSSACSTQGVWSIICLLCLLISLVLTNFANKHFSARNFFERFKFFMVETRILFIQAVLIAIYCSYYMLFIQERYFMPITPLIILFFGFIFSLFFRNSEKLPFIPKVFLIVAYACFFPTVYYAGESLGATSPPPSSKFKDFIDAGHWVFENYRTSKLGGFNVGFMGYFSGGRIVNLDGMINNEAMKSRMKKNLGKYIYEQRIEYLIDGKNVIDLKSPESYFTRYEPEFGKFLKLVEIIPGTSFYDGIAIFKVDLDRLKEVYSNIFPVKNL